MHGRTHENVFVNEAPILAGTPLVFLPISPGHVQPHTAGASGERGRAVCEPREEGNESATVPPTDLEGRGRRVPESLAGCRGRLGLVEAAEFQVQDPGEGENGVVG